MRTVACEEKIRLYTQRCLALAINEAMIAAEDENWFATLAANEDKVRAKNPTFAVIKEDHTRISQCDFQAVLKILSYRKQYRETTFQNVTQKEKDKINNTLTCVIDFRNSELAHKAVLEEKDCIPGEYSYDNAILDMMYLLHFFPNIHGPAPKSEYEDEIDAKNICYYDEATKVFTQYKAEGGQRDYLMIDAIKKYKLTITVDQFCEACDQLNIARFYPKEQRNWYFCSADAEKDVVAIKEYIRTKTIEKELTAAKREKEKAERAAQRAQQSADASRQTAARKRQGKHRYVVLGVVVVMIILAFSCVSGIIGQLKNIFNAESSQDKKTNALIQEEIDNFVSDFGNTIQLTVGETHKPQAAIWLKGNDDADCYSTNEDVATISEGGFVKAIAEGEVFIVIRSNTMFKVYKYIIVNQ